MTVDAYASEIVQVRYLLWDLISFRGFQILYVYNKKMQNCGCEFLWFEVLWDLISFRGFQILYVYNKKCRIVVVNFCDLKFNCSGCEYLFLLCNFELKSIGSRSSDMIASSTMRPVGEILMKEGSCTEKKWKI